MVPYIHIQIPSIFGIRLEAFGILVFIACLVGIHFTKRRAAQLRLNPVHIDNIALYCCILAGLVGAHLWNFVFYEPERFFANPMIFFTQFRSGLSSYGGFITAFVAIFIYARMKKLPFHPYGEAILFGLLPAWIFGRLACTTAHDHPGKFTDFFLGVKYPEGTRHDLGFYELLLTIPLTALIYGLAAQKKERPQGFYLVITFLIYGVFRFFLDFLRIADATYFGLTFAQYSCIAIVIYSIYLITQFKKSKT